MEDTKYTLVAAVVKRGFSGDVMEAAKGAGARGGTIVHSRHIGIEEFAHLLENDMQGEKEIVIILAEIEKKMPIMQSISERCGINSNAKGFVFSMPIDSVMGI